jgi:hypothetical protein
MERTFDKPDAFKRNESNGLHEVDRAASESFVLLEALGTPKIFYAQKANKYFKDVSCTKAFMDAELIALGLPIPAEIESKRRKIIKEHNDEGKAVDFNALYMATSPKEVLPPKRIQEQLISNSPEAIEQRIINRLNRSTVGK